MPEDEGDQLLCYNKGCGIRFYPDGNSEESCQFHPGAPVFHDAYKGWSCCKKKCTDFTEFLNIKGCTKGKHNPEKPPAPEYKKVDNSNLDEVIEVKVPEPIVMQTIPRPPPNTPKVKIEPEVSPTLREMMKNLKLKKSEVAEPILSSKIPVGTSCKNNGCKQSYEEDETQLPECQYHPGYPVFHEGLKFWSCCKRKTTDFDTFLSQPGCSQGPHLWLQSKSVSKSKDLKIDWHQTPSTVVIAIYAKKYDPDSSFVFLTPVRIEIEIYFPEDEYTYAKTLDLCGVINVQRSGAKMLPTKVEINLSKAVPGKWSNLYEEPYKETPSSSNPEPLNVKSSSNSNDDDLVDLSCL